MAIKNCTPLFAKESMISMLDRLGVNARDGQLNAYKHTGFWHPMDMLKDKEDLNKMWANNIAPWKVWKK